MEGVRRKVAVVWARGSGHQAGYGTPNQAGPLGHGHQRRRHRRLAGAEHRLRRSAHRPERTGST